MSEEDGDEELAEILAIADGTKAVLNILNDNNNSEIAMRILASSASCILCVSTHSESQAIYEFNMFVEAIRRALILAKKNNFVEIGRAHV